MQDEKPDRRKTPGKRGKRMENGNGRKMAAETENGPTMGFWPFFLFRRPFSAISGLGPFATFLFSRELCTGRVSSSLREAESLSRLCPGRGRCAKPNAVVATSGHPHGQSWVDWAVCAESSGLQCEWMGQGTQRHCVLEVIQDALPLKLVRRSFYPAFSVLRAGPLK